MEMDAGPQLELLPMFESIAPLRVETAAGKTVIFKRRAKPRPKPIPVRPPPPLSLSILKIQDAMGYGGLGLIHLCSAIIEV